MRAAAVAARTSAATPARTSARRARVDPVMLSPLRSRRIRPRPSVSPNCGRSSPDRGARARAAATIPERVRDTRCRRRRCRRRSRGRSSPCQPARSSAARIPGRSATPSPGRARSAQPRVGSRQSFTCTPAIRRDVPRDLVEQVGRVPEVPDVELDPDAPGCRSRRSAPRASASVFTSDQSSIPSRWKGSSARRTPARSASAATVRSPSTTSARAPSGSRSPAGPVRQTIAVGPKAARRCTDAQRRLDPLAAGRRAPRGAAAAGSRESQARPRRSRARSSRAARAPRCQAPRRASAPRSRSRRRRPPHRRARRRRSSRQACSPARSRTGGGLRVDRHAELQMVSRV